MTTIPQVSESELTFVGEGLSRPECIVVTAKGEISASDHRGGIQIMSPEGATSLLLPTDGESVEGFLPNGYSLCPDGSYAIANLGPAGGAYQLFRDGTLKPLLTELNGESLPPVNFVNRDELGRIWISFSTRQFPRELAFKREVTDGFIVLMDDRGARVVADEIGYTNENKLSPDGNWLYVNETIARRLSRYAVASNGELGTRETVTEFGDGIFPDGLAFDIEGGVWIASVVSNRLVRVTPDGKQQIVLDGSDPAIITGAEAAYAENRFTREHIDGGRDGLLGNLASVTFGGPDLRTVYLGSLFAPRIACFKSPIAGAKPPHWDF